MKQFIVRSLLLNTIGAVLLGIYLLINQRTDTVNRFVEMPDWVPFWPLMTIPYLLMLFVPWLGAFLLKEDRHVYQYLVASALSFLIIGSLWYFFPTEMTRPATPEGSLYDIHRILIAHDRPVCIVPCGHVMGPIIIVYLYAKEKPQWLIWMLPALGLGIISIATSWQHRPIDIATGSVITLVAVLATHRIFRRPTTQHSSEPEPAS